MQQVCRYKSSISGTSGGRLCASQTLNGAAAAAYYPCIWTDAYAYVALLTWLASAVYHAKRTDESHLLDITMALLLLAYGAVLSVRRLIGPWVSNTNINTNTNRKGKVDTNAGAEIDIDTGAYEGTGEEKLKGGEEEEEKERERKKGEEKEKGTNKRQWVQLIALIAYSAMALYTALIGCRVYAMLVVGSVTFSQHMFLAIGTRI